MSEYLVKMLFMQLGEEKKGVLCVQDECLCATFCGMQQTQREHHTVLFLSPLV